MSPMGPWRICDGQPDGSTAAKVTHRCSRAHASEAEALSTNAPSVEQPRGTTTSKRPRTSPSSHCPFRRRGPHSATAALRSAANEKRLRDREYTL